MRRASFIRTLDAPLRTTFESQLAEALQTPGLSPLLLRGREDLFPRFAAYYEPLCHLPRRARRTLESQWKRSLAAIALLLALGQAPALAATITVGGSCTLVDAITAANTDTAIGGCRAGSGADVIELTADVILTAVNNDTDNPNGLPSVTSVITVNGHGHTIARSSAEGIPAFRLLYIAYGGNLTLNQVTLKNGYLAFRCGRYGGCYGGPGGAVLNFGTVALVGSAVSGNSAKKGSGGGLANGGIATLINSTLSGNSADVGGGLDNIGTATLINSTLSSNSAAASSGGLVNGGTATLMNSTLSGNSSDVRGGGLANYGTATLTNSTLSGNNATYVGGLYNAGTVTLTNSTLSGNTGGGLYNQRGTATLTNTIIANSTGGDCANGFAGTITPTGVNLIEDGSCSASSFPAGTDPKLGPLANNGGPTLTHALLAGSPAIDAIALGVGGCGTNITTDQRGVSRPQPAGGNCDIGAFELQQTPPVSIESIIDFFDEAVKNGELRGTGPGNSAKHRLRAVRHMLLAAGDFLDHHKTKKACEQLEEVREHIDTDGKLKRGEFVTGPAAPTLAQMIQDLRKQLSCKHKAQGR